MRVSRGKPCEPPPGKVADPVQSQFLRDREPVRHCAVRAPRGRVEGLGVGFGSVGEGFEVIRLA